MTQSARGARSPGHEWAGLREVLPGWRRVVAVAERDAWVPWAFAARGGGCGPRPWLGAGAEGPSSPSWGCRAGCQGGTVTCAAAADGACGGGASAGWKRGCAHWAPPSRGHASSCCGWSTRTRCRCQSASRHRSLRRRPKATSPLRPRCCWTLWCCGAARPRSLLSHCSGFLRA